MKNLTKADPHYRNIRVTNQNSYGDPSTLTVTGRH